MPQGLRRVGTASAAVSAGALVLVLATPATAAAEECKKGVDPETTIENWKCQLGNIREALTPKSPAPEPTPEPTRSKPGEKKTAPSKDSGNKKPGNRNSGGKKPGNEKAGKPRKPAAAPRDQAPAVKPR